MGYGVGLETNLCVRFTSENLRCQLDTSSIVHLWEQRHMSQIVKGTHLTFINYFLTESGEYIPNNGKLFKILAMLFVNKEKSDSHLFIIYSVQSSLPMY